MKPRVPNCENKAPYCVRGGLPMDCVAEDVRTFLFRCRSCGQCHIVNRPEYTEFVRKRREAGLEVNPHQQKYF